MTLWDTSSCAVGHPGRTVMFAHFLNTALSSSRPAPGDDGLLEFPQPVGLRIVRLDQQATARLLNDFGKRAAFGFSGPMELRKPCFEQKDSFSAHRKLQGPKHIKFLQEGISSRD